MARRLTLEPVTDRTLSAERLQTCANELRKNLTHMRPATAQEFEECDAIWAAIRIFERRAAQLRAMDKIQ